MVQEGALLGMQSQVHPVPLFESSTWAPWRLGTGLICVTAASLVPDECPPRLMNDWKNTVWGGWLANKRLTKASWAQLGGPARGMKPFHWIPLSIDLHTTTSYQKPVKSPYFLLGTEDQDVGTGSQHPFLPENVSWWCQDVKSTLSSTEFLLPQAGPKGWGSRWTSEEGPGLQWWNRFGRRLCGKTQTPKFCPLY